MISTKQNIVNHVETPKDKVKTPNRLSRLLEVYPDRREDFKTFCLNEGMSQLTFNSLATMHQSTTMMINKLLDRMVTKFKLTEPK